MKYGQTSSSKRYSKTAHNLPQRNLKFTGRQEILERLQEKLKLEGQSATVQIAAAIDGIGKTQVAKEYAYQSLEKGNYRFIGWLDASKSEELSLQFLALADALEIDPNLNSEERKDAVLQNLKRESGWLLIFDDAPDYQSLLPYYPQGKGHVLVTSQNINKLSNQSVILNIFNREESIEYILKEIEVRGAIDEPLSKEADALAELLADLPLALTQAVTYIRETKISIRDYINLFEIQRELLSKNENLSKDYYESTLKITFNISFELVQKENKLAVSTLLNYLGYLHHWNIPLMILEKIIIDKFVLDNVIRTLSRYALIEVDTNQQTVNLHKIVQLAIQHKENNPEMVIESVNVILHEYMDSLSDVPLLERIKKWKHFMIQSKAVLGFAKEIRLRTEAVMNILHVIGFYCQYVGEYNKALNYYEEALATNSQISGKEGPEVALCLNGIGTLYVAHGEYIKALQYFERSLKIRRRVLDKNHIDTAATLNNIGLIYNSLGDNHKALKHFEQALEIKFQILDSNHLSNATTTSIATTINSIGAVHSSNCNYSEALKYYEKALEIRREVLGEENLDFARSLNSVGSMYSSLGDHEKGLKYCMQALAIRRKAYGEYDEVASSLYTIGRIYESQRQYGEALMHYDGALKIKFQTAGNVPPEFATVLNSIAMVHKAQGNHQMALDCLEQALVMVQKKLGPNHPDTLNVEDEIAIIQDELNSRSGCVIQ